MRAPRAWRVLAACLVVVAFLSAPAEAAKRRKKKKAAPKPTPTATPEPVVYGPPAPTPPPFLRAAGATVSYQPGLYLVLAEVGMTGKVFRLDEKTEVTVVPRTGDRVRILYVEGPDGPLARKILPGPYEVTT
ncbi:hypothetical protein FBQ97_20815, partial [Acidobacteria bacterium ACD]|nr:hypothetical protein [Acidobacteria bacterium ACD]